MSFSEKIQNWLFQLLVDKPHTWRGLLIAYFFITALSLAAHISIKNDFNYEWASYVSALFIITIIWLIYKYKYPRNNKRQTGIIIALFARDAEALKLKKTFICELEKNINSALLGDVFKIIPLKNHQAELVKNEADIKKINKKIYGHFYLYGDIRNEVDGKTNKYFINLEGYVAHQPAPIPVSQELSMDFRNVLPKELNFADFFGYRCIRATGKIAYLATKYVVGMAAFLSENPFLAYRLHQDLENEFKEYKSIETEMKDKAEMSKFDKKYLGQLKNKLALIISNEALILSIIYGRNNRPAEHLNFLQIAEQKNPNNYGVWLLKAITAFFNENDSASARKYVKRAAELASQSCEWRYSKAFLDFWDGHVEAAYKECQKIDKSSYNNEHLTVDDVENFNLKILEQRKDKPQLYFWIGYLVFKKRKDFVLAKKYFQDFIVYGGNNIPFLKNKVDSFMIEIDQSNN
ncbi:MAG: hypothetical protein ACD_72C00442G0006 [uncultured bacterium]|nr:MAG: hypothetical protein ACD_72C00442G0006 [uncultured bacterium]